MTIRDWPTGLAILAASIAVLYVAFVIEGGRASLDNGSYEIATGLK